MSAAQMLVSMNWPSSSEYKSVENFVQNEKTQCEEEETWIQCKEDLITLRPGREHAWLDAGIERLLRRVHCSLVEYIFCSKVSSDPRVIKDSRVHSCITGDEDENGKPTRRR